MMDSDPSRPMILVRGRDKMMSSTLVETVSINYEDFNESFLTCGTCLCMYDGQEHTPKLLPCSHTVCRQCLERIVSTQTRDTGTFRCPICRETINVPRGGVSALPPSFLVNQLLDLMARQRREVVPKCSNHPSQELLFCETCDCVFCAICTGEQHGSSTCGDGCEHTVIPFSIAIKRMSEILLYKAHQCIGKLNRAHENVSQEMNRLDGNMDHTYELINQSFQVLINLCETRRQEMLGSAKKTRGEKMKVLQEQLTLINTEKFKVQEECEGLQYQVEVRNITKKISDLNSKLEQVGTLLDPRENCFIKYEHEHNTVLAEVRAALDRFGRIHISKTFPALCSAALSGGGLTAVAHLGTTITVRTVDYHGDLRTSGGDPVAARIAAWQDDEVAASNPATACLPYVVRDREDGTYQLQFVPPAAGDYRVSITIFEREIKSSPLRLVVSEHNNPVAQAGGRGSGPGQFLQPVGVAVDGVRGEVFVADAGNSRVQVLSATSLQYLRQLDGVGLEERSGTGVALCLPPSSSSDEEGGTLVAVNWRSKLVTEMTVKDGHSVNQFGHTDMGEPVDIAVDSMGDLFVADNGSGAVLVFEPSGKLVRRIGGGGDCPAAARGPNLISAVAVGRHDEVVVADARLRVFTKSGKFLREIHGEANTKSKGRYGGVVVDRDGLVLATRSEKSGNVVQVFSYEGALLFSIDSWEARLKRPSGLAVTDDGHVVVVDLGNDCVKMYRYK